jgi:hypothetical protein
MVQAMPTIKVERTSSLKGSDSFKLLTQLLDQDKELRKLDPHYKCDFVTETLSGVAESKLFTAKLKVFEASGGSKVELTVDLPFHLALVKGMVQRTLEKKIDETLAKA